MRAVIDTNVLFEGLTVLGPSADVLDAWVAGAFEPCVSTALALEYEEVLTNKLGPAKKKFAIPALQALLRRASFVPIYVTIRPMSPDPDDDFVIECAFNAAAALVTLNLKDFRSAEQALGLIVLPPADFLRLIAEHKE